MSTTIAARYEAILENAGPAFLNPAPNTDNLSMPFLVSEPKDPTAPRIMVIGREFGAKGWRVPYEGGGIATYVAKALDTHRNFLANHLAAPKTRGATFFNFMRDLQDKLGAGGLIYSNLLCIDSAGRDPRKSEHYAKIKSLSKQLLDAQLDHFQPNVIIFANGASTVKVRREFFPIEGDNKVCVSRRHWEDIGIRKEHLWEFELLGKFRCYRIQHPATVRGRADAEIARQQLIKEIAQTLQRS
ncbi:hypothetical protein [Paracidovorax citrulli]